MGFYAVSNCNSVTTFRDNISVHLEGSGSQRRMNIFGEKNIKHKGVVTNKVAIRTATQKSRPMSISTYLRNE
jgi:hypothetical protein